MKKLLILLMLTTNCYAANWECVAKFGLSCHTWRMEVPEGWVVSGDTLTSDHAYAMTFVPDQLHVWKL